MNRVIIGHAPDALKMLGDGIAHQCVTSPPYWGLRDYKAPSVVWPDGWEGQLGLEPTPELYVKHLVEIFREVKRVLRPDGTCWLNLGDSYNNAGSSRQGTGLDGKQRGGATGPDGELGYKKRDLRHSLKGQGIKHKDLVGIPWTVAFALRADGWYLRSDIIWAKPNPMPESVTDRPTKAHEYLFLLTKSGKYFYDADAVREPHGSEWIGRAPTLHLKANADRCDSGDRARSGNPAGRNLRSVWTITTRGYPEAHFAVFPTEIPARCIKTSPTKICLECGAGWERVVEKKETNRKVTGTGTNLDRGDTGLSCNAEREYKTLGFRPTCSCEGETGRAVILDPFGGRGTTAQAAFDLGRDFIHIDIGYPELAEKTLGLYCPEIEYVPKRNVTASLMVKGE